MISIGNNTIIAAQTSLIPIGPIVIGSHCTTGIGSVFISGKILSIGDWVHFGPGCKVFSVNHDIRNVHSCMMAKPIIKESTIIGDNVWVGANAVILSGIHVGKGAVIGAGAVVTKDVPAYSIVVGVPAKVLRNRMIEVTK